MSDELENDELSTPNITYFLKSIAGKWRNLGLHLRVETGKLDRIEIDRIKSELCMPALIQYWLDNMDCSWSRLIKACKEIEQKKLADKIHSKLLEYRFRGQLLQEDIFARNLEKVAGKWYEIGTSLKVSKSQLDRIKSDDTDDYVKLSRMLSTWKKEGKKKCSWQQIIDALVSGSMYEVIDSPPEVVNEGIEDVPDYANQSKIEHIRELIKLKHKCEEWRSRLGHFVERINNRLKELASKKNVEKDRLEEIKKSMEITVNRHVSNCKELDSCISLLKSTNDTSEYEHTSNKLNECIVELAEFSIDLEYTEWVVAGNVSVGWIGAGISWVILGVVMVSIAMKNDMVGLFGFILFVLGFVVIYFNGALGAKSSNPKNMVLLQLIEDTVGKCSSDTEAIQQKIRAMKDALVDAAYIDI